MSENSIIQLDNAIMKALKNFQQKLEQQRFFQIQNNLLQKVVEEVRKMKYCGSEQIEELSLQYEDFYRKLSETGRSYENIVEEKNLVDTYSAFEKFLFDCFYSIYVSFPKHLGNQINVNTDDLFIARNIDICKRNVIEQKVKEFIQKNNVRDTINGFDKNFKIKISIPEEELNILYEISLIRNLIIHNNGIVNRVYIEQVKKFLKEKVKYTLNEGDSVLSKLKNLGEDLKNTSTKVCEKIAEIIIRDGRRLKEHHEKML